MKANKTQKKNARMRQMEPILEHQTIDVQRLSSEDQLFQDISAMIEESRYKVSSQINSEMVELYWHIGQRIKRDTLKNRKAEYGKQIIESLATRLITSYGKGFNARNLFHMLHFVEVFPNDNILHTLCAKLSWSHLRELIYIQDELKRHFYLDMCSYEGWSVRVLQDRIRSMLYERTAISNKPEETIKKELAALRQKQKIGKELVFRDPYLLGFLGLADTYSEHDLENAILHNLGLFLIEMGNDFAFLGRQKRITVDNKDFYIDLLFYHRGLRALVIIELKLGEFQPEYKGQMELYLRYLEKYEMREGENLPVGLILCAGKSKEVIELLRLDEDRIKVAEYWTRLPSRHLLEQHLHRAVNAARAQLVTIDEQHLQSQEVNFYALLQQSQSITPFQVRQQLKLNTKELRRQVRQGQRQGWLKVSGRGRATCYSLQDAGVRQ